MWRLRQPAMWTLQHSPASSSSMRNHRVSLDAPLLASARRQDRLSATAQCRMLTPTIPLVTVAPCVAPQLVVMQRTDSGTRALALRWLAGFVALAQQEMLPLAAPVLAAVLPCIAHPATEIAQVQIGGQQWVLGRSGTRNAGGPCKATQARVAPQGCRYATGNPVRQSLAVHDRRRPRRPTGSCCGW